MGKAKVTGQIIDRSEIGKPDEFADKNMDEMIEVVCSLLGELGYSVQSSSGLN